MLAGDSLPSGALRCRRSRLAASAPSALPVRKDESRRESSCAARSAARSSRRESAPGRIRTCDLALRRRALYPLSYRRERNLRFALRFRSRSHTLPGMELTYRPATLRLAAPFRISRETSTEEEVLWIEVRHDDVSGFGEATPQAHYGESLESAAAFLDDAGELLGDDPFALEAIGRRLAEHPGELAAKAAVDAALHDLCGKLAGLPVYRLLGLERAGPPTSWTIWLGDPDDMARRAEAVDPRFRRLKLKLGGRDGLDVERVRAVRSVTALPLMVDVNEYWTLDEAVDAIAELEPLGVEYVEQPLPAGDPAGPRAEAPRRASDLRRRGLPHARRRRGLRGAGSRHQHQAREVRRHPRGRSDGRRRPRSRPGRHARLHGGVGASRSRRVRRWRASATTSTSTATCSSRRIRGRASPFEEGVQLAPDGPGLGVHEAVPDPR